MNIEDIRNYILRDEYEISVHAEKERYAENISISDIETAIASGELLEDYPDDPRGESCLILGYSEGRAIHIVCGYTNIRSLRIITVYLPKVPKWIDERTRREKR
ncbi:MAG: DUF4258 domain-containing protein [bacterium]|nr:DUF4258 domain-containing protein [bacterium]